MVILPEKFRGRVILTTAEVCELCGGISYDTRDRIEASDPNFPRSFRLRDRGPRFQLASKVVAYLERKAIEGGALLPPDSPEPGPVPPVEKVERLRGNGRRRVLPREQEA